MARACVSTYASRSAGDGVRISVMNALATHLPADEAVTCREQMLSYLEELGAGEGSLIVLKTGLGRSYVDAGRHDDALAIFREAHERNVRLRGPFHLREHHRRDLFGLEPLGLAVARDLDQRLPARALHDSERPALHVGLHGRVGELGPPHVCEGHCVENHRDGYREWDNRSSLCSGHALANFGPKGPGVVVLNRFNRMNKHKMEPIPTFTL